ncbi:MAG: hypothetical protein ABH886_05230 [Candidatus Desantisbacteria bacterium]
MFKFFIMEIQRHRDMKIKDRTRMIWIIVAWFKSGVTNRTSK